MLLTIDIGNTAVTLGVFRDTPATKLDPNDLSPAQRLVTTLRIATDSRRLADEYAILLRNLLEFRGIAPADITAACICSVVPPLTGLFEDVCRSFFGVPPLLVNSQIDLGMPVRYDNPRDVGPDRIVDAVAAVKLYGAPVVVVDLGTATVFDAVSRDGEYLGGAIAPGINLSADALYDNTSLLRRVELVAPAGGRGAQHYRRLAVRPRPRLRRPGYHHGPALQSRNRLRRQGRRHRRPRYRHRRPRPRL